MVSFENLTLSDDIPIYLQLIQYVKRGIVSGSIHNQDPMPSRRVLSSLLGVNPNTIQKAYRMLEEEGLILSQSGAKSVITVKEEIVMQLRDELIETDVKSIIIAMQSMGIEREAASILFNNLWEETS